MNKNSNISRPRQQSKIDDPLTNILQSGDIYPNSLIPLFGAIGHNTAQSEDKRQFPGGLT